MLTEKLSILQRLIMVELFAINHAVNRKSFVDHTNNKIETESSWEIEPAYAWEIEKSLDELVQMGIIQEIEGQGEYHGKKFIGWVDVRRIPGWRDMKELL